MRTGSISWSARKEGSPIPRSRGRETPDSGSRRSGPASCARRRRPLWERRWYWPGTDGSVRLDAMTKMGQASDCIFCRIAAKEVPADVVYASDRVVAFRDGNPKAPTHILLIPVEHIESVPELRE